MKIEGDYGIVMNILRYVGGFASLIYFFEEQYR